MPQQESTKSEEILSSPEQESRPIDKLAAEGNAIYRRFKDADMSTVTGVLTLGGLGIAAGAGAFTTAPVWVPLAVGGLGVAALASDYIGDNQEDDDEDPGWLGTGLFKTQYNDDGSGSSDGSSDGSGSGMGSGSDSGAPSRNEPLPARKLDASSILTFNPGTPGGGMKPFDLRYLNVFQLDNLSAENSYLLKFNATLFRLAVAERESGNTVYAINTSAATGYLQYQSHTAMRDRYVVAAHEYRRLMINNPEYIAKYDREKEIWGRNQFLVSQFQSANRGTENYVESQFLEPDPQNPGQMKFIDARNPYPFVYLDTRQDSNFTSMKYLDSRFAPDELAFIDTFGGLLEGQVQAVINNSYFQTEDPETKELIKQDILPELSTTGSGGSAGTRNKKGIETVNERNLKLVGTFDGVFPYWMMYISHFLGANGSKWWIQTDGILKAANIRNKVQWTSPSLGLTVTGNNPQSRWKIDAETESNWQMSYSFVNNHKFASVKDPVTNKRFYTQSDMNNNLHRTHPSYIAGHIMTSTMVPKTKTTPAYRVWFFGSTWDVVIGDMENDILEYYVNNYNKYLAPTLSKASTSLKLSAFQPAGKEQLLLFSDCGERIKDYYSRKDNYYRALTGLDQESPGITAIEIFNKNLPGAPYAGTPQLERRKRVTSDLMGDIFDHFFNFYSLCAANIGYGLYGEAAGQKTGINVTEDVINAAQKLGRRIETLEDELRKEHWIITNESGENRLMKDTERTLAPTAPATPTASPTATAGPAGAEYPARGGSGEQ